MPTPSLYFEKQAFSSLIAEKIALFQEELANACLRLASDREAQLLAENAVLRDRLEKAGVVAEKNLSNSSQASGTKGTTSHADITNVEVPEQPTLPDNSGNNPMNGKGFQLVCSPVVQHSGNEPMNVKGLQVTCSPVVQREAFEPLQELCKLTIDNEIFLNDIDQTSAEKADAGFTSMRHHIDQLEVDIVKFVKTGHCPVIDPSSVFRLAWDILGIPILAWDLVTIPLGVFNLTLPESANWATLIYWTLDIPFTFFTGIFDADGKEVYDHKAIAQRYLHGFFLLDFGMIAADWTHLLIGMFTDADVESLKNVTILRTLRISRFIRLLRLNKLKAKVQDLEDCLKNQFYLDIVDVILKVLQVVAINHYIGCLWYAIGDASFLAPEDKRWVTTYQSAGEVMVDGSFWYKYTTCLHWAITMLTPGGTNIEPQNSYERLYNIFVLLFGLVVFSSFVASLTQARISMSKMMAKFERQHWLLREFCRQHGVSNTLQIDMRRYIDIVVSPSQRKLKLSDIVLVKSLTPDLQERLNAEIFSVQIVPHPFFAHVREKYCSLMNGICSKVLETTPLAKKDVAFAGGRKAQFMLILVSGRCDYILAKDPASQTDVRKGQWASEAALWTMWTHQGQLQATQDTQALSADSAKLCAQLLRSAVCMLRVQNYASAFCQSLNDLVRNKETLTDLHDFASSYFVGDRKASQ